jgi:hypothetical protein
MKRWTRARNKVRKGLERRREVEAALYQMRWYCPQLSHRTGHDFGVWSVAAALLVCGVAPEMACGWGVTPP